MSIFNASYQSSKGMSSKRFISGAVAATILSGVFCAPAVFAQGMVLEEIIVTARKRQESIQDVPISITAFDAAAIERAHMDSISDLEKYIPNVDFSNNPYAGQSLGATIRGVGFTDLEKSFEPAVGVSIDGVFLANSTGAAIDAFDLQSVEVLRGPQGTLYGRNTVGGVINVTRSRPTEEAGFKLGTRFTNNGGEEFLLVANTGQIGDALSTKIYAFDKKSETYAVNRLNGTVDDQTDITSYGAAFLYEPNDKLEALISIDVFDDDSQGPPIYNFTQPGELFCDTPAFLASIGVFTPGSANVGCASESIDIARDSNFELYTRGVPFVTTLEGSSVTAQIDYEISDNLRFTSITGIRESDEQLLEEGLGAPNLAVAVAPGVEITFPILYTNRIQESDQFSQEFRLAGEVGDNLSYVSGIYYLDAEYSLIGGEFPDGTFGTSQVFGAIAGDDVYNQKTEALSLFVDGTYDVSDSFSISAGLRYSDETKDARKDFIIAASAANNGATTGDVSASFSNTSGRVILQYDFSDDISVYGGLSRGFRSGGFNGRAAAPSVIGPYDAETVDSFEAGFRAEFFGNRLRLNPTIFFSDYQDKQEENLIAVGDANTETTVQNASAVDIKGFELEILALISPELTIRGSLGLLDTEFSEFLVAADPSDPTNTSVVDVSDTRNIRSSPETTFSIGATYTKAISQGQAQIIFDAGYSYQDDLFTSASIDPLGLGRDSVPGAQGADFSLTYQTLRDATNFKITAYINDAFDDNAGRQATSIIIPGLFTFGAGQATKVYGLEAEVEF